ncbi:oxidative stress defense protein [Shewanella mesophila]|uniref:oxidative stress defense protein n=1 Tax=Shewanella mesophila TaxID=2864208 RepID=UPI001C65679D|nr:oxidative stress defense protein [Shewanella mesophila]QYJ85670.1 oxidative stress defense protein [Shewanella mesophila]
MKKSVLAAILSASLLTATFAITAPKAQASDINFPHIETIGTSQIVVKADMAELNVEVVTEAKTPAEAKAGSDKAVADFIGRLTKAGVKREQIQSANLQLYPNHVYDPQTRTNNEVGYKASRKVTVTITELDTLNDILDSALAQGINRINNIAFKSSKEAELIEEARLLAIKDAQQKAKFLAKGFGERLAGVWEVRYFDQRPIQPVMYRMDAAPKGNVAESYQEAQMTISDRVEVVYRLK